MKTASKILAGSLAGVGLILPFPAMHGATSKEARVTQIIREVNLLPTNSDPRAAALNDKVSDDTGVRTGGESRSELTFPDLTITRLGANTIFSFAKSGRTATVDSGSILLRVPKDSGGGSIRSSAVTVAITGTTVIFEKNSDGQSRLIALEGTARVALNTKPKEWRRVRAGEMLEVPAGADVLPMPVSIDLDDLMRTHPLIVDFKPLPSEPLIREVVRRAPPPSNTTPPRIVVNPTFPPGVGNPPPPAVGQPPPIIPPPNRRPPRVTPTPLPSPSPTPRNDPKASPSATRPPQRYPTPTPTAPPERTPKPTPSPTKPPQTNPKPTPTPTPRPKATPTPQPKATPTPKRTPRPTSTPSPSPVILRSRPTSTPKPAATKAPIYKRKQPSSPSGPR
jgi:hypothetical protein